MAMRIDKPCRFGLLGERPFPQDVMHYDPLGEYIGTLRVLHVEDDAIIQFSIASMLEAQVGEVLTAANGREGLDIFERERPDIVITDIRTPIMSGLEMVEAIRSRDVEVPIIVTTAHNETDYLMKAIELGIDKYVVKPLDRAQLTQAVSKCGHLLHQRRVTEETNRFNRFLLDTNPNFIATLTGGSIDYINTPFLEYLGFETLDAFRRDGGALGDYIESVSGMKDKDVRRDWFRHLLDNSGADVVVTFNTPPAKGDATRSRAYLATFNAFPQSDRYVVCFTDVTRLEDEKRSLFSKATTDHLTGIANRMCFLDWLEDEIKRSERYGAPLSLVMFDIDDFKHINDRHGHDVGDQVLQELCVLVTANLRTHDRFARWGGEEFMVLVPGCSAPKACDLAAKLRRLVAENPMAGLPGITCSFGVTMLRPDDTAKDMLRRADKAMYAAKEQGKNVVARR